VRRELDERAALPLHQADPRTPSHVRWDQPVSCRAEGAAGDDGRPLMDEPLLDEFGVDSAGDVALQNRIARWTFVDSGHRGGRARPAMASRLRGVAIRGECFGERLIERCCFHSEPGCDLLAVDDERRLEQVSHLDQFAHRGVGQAEGA
jgi:hypothetical protein